MANATILAIEDEGIVAKHIERNLKAAGYHVEVASSGEEAIEKAGAIRPDLALVDIVLKGKMDGIETGRWIHNRYDIPLIYLTAYGDEATIQRVKATEPFGYILKPFEEWELRTTVELALYKHKMDERLKINQRWLAAVLQCIGDAVVVTDARTRITHMNPLAETLTGWTSQEAFGRELAEIVCTLDEKTKVARESLVVKALEWNAHIPLSEEVVLKTRDGRETSISTTITLLRDDRQNTLGVVLVFRDTTHRKWLENALRQRADELAAADRAKTEFLATVSHELRNPLTSMLGWIDLLRSGKLDPAATQRAQEIIERSAKAQQQLIEDMLDIARITEGRLRLDMQPINLRPIIEGAVDSVRPATEAKQIHIRVTLDPAVGLVLGDPSRLQQVLWNLLSNAIKFSPAGASIQIQLERVGAQAQIRVSDTGMGIRADFLPYVFQPFRQDERTRMPAHSGLGIGLTIVRNIVEMHGGTIQAESPGEGEGAVFRIQLPLWTGTEGSASSGEDNPSAPIAEAVKVLQGLRVLIAEVDNDVSELISTALRQEGAEVTAVFSAEAALAAFKEGQQDVLLCNILLPDRSGYDLMRAIRAIEAEQGGQIPAAALTTCNTAEDFQFTFTAGFQMHIPKPVDLSKLAVAVAGLARQVKKADKRAPKASREPRPEKKMGHQ